MSDARQPQLDSVRAAAVLLVLWQHTMRPRMLFTHDAGAIGVVMFFVLSGFLITGILLDAKRDAEVIGASMGGVLRRFYIRRFLRIFPLYYAVVIAAWTFGDPQVREYVRWLATYSTNFLMAGLGTNIGLPTPFWSLAVEEQFYLFWPCIVLFVARKRLPWILVGMVALSLVSRFLIAALVPDAREHTITMPTWSALDGLAIGGLLAWSHRSGRDTSRAVNWALVVGALLIAGRLVLINFERGRPIHMGLWMFPWALVSAWLVDRAARHRLPQWLDWRPLTWIGMVSYGMYVYHRPLMSVFSIGLRRGWDVFALVTAVTLVVASVSWIVFERPINDQKRRWPYVPRRARVAAPDAVPASVATLPSSLAATEPTAS